LPVAFSQHHRQRLRVSQPVIRADLDQRKG
jgi:hypothetical protein